MLERVLFWLRKNFGFSRKESKGFLFFLPILILFYAGPSLYKMFAFKTFPKAPSSENLDSLLSAGWQPKISDPTFNRADTVKVRSSSKSTGLKKIPFSEADSVVLQIVPGIGTALAGRVVKFRENLGGLHKKEQLLDVYGISPEVAERIWEYFEFDPAIFRKVNINLGSTNDLATHPYISYGQAKVLVAYREQHGPYTSPDDLVKVRIFTDEWIQSIAPYLEF
ncbi:ComEA family DNA-binding protein [Algoriphagus namhaensis]